MPCPGRAAGHEYGDGDDCVWCSQPRPIPVTWMLAGSFLGAVIVFSVLLASLLLDR